MEGLIAQFADLGEAGILLALFFGTFVSEDLACLTAGSLAASGRIDLAAAIAACFLGIFVGDLLLYGAGRAFGGRLLALRFAARFISSERLDQAAGWLRERGASAIFVSRFVSGLRLPTYLAAGALKMDPWRFAAYFALAAAVWTPVLVGAAAIWKISVPGGTIVGVVAAFLLIRFAFRMTDWKNRRSALGRLRRVVLWEFWPLWVFYIPVVIYVCGLAVRFRALAFTAANPGMPAGGFVGESKDEIYRLIERSGSGSPHLLRYTRIASGPDTVARYHAAVQFLDDNSLNYPVVIKPDAGERGDGVAIVRNEEQLRETLKNSSRDVLLQEHFDGVEVSVFYCRIPGESNGRIFSITEKCFPTVEGDGTSTIEHLILMDARAHIIAKKYLDHARDRLHRVLAIGETVRLVEIGSHSKGAIFRDGEWLRTPELESKIDEMCCGIPGFYFGRFDIRAASFDDLKHGRNFRIIELNGVTSESTNIYDRRFSLFDAYRILFRQWRLAFQIGRENIQSGTRAATARELISLVLADTLPSRRSVNVHPLHRVS